MSPNGKTMAIFTVMVLAARLFATVDCAPHRRSHLRTLRLCSKRLSDALYLVCSERGYNEPFSYSSEDEVQAAPRAPNGPGLVEECCYHSCSYIQLEQYCKANSEEKRATNSHDVIEESVRIVKLSRTFVRRARSTDERRSKCISDITERERPTARIQPVGLLNDRPS